MNDRNRGRNKPMLCDNDNGRLVTRCPSGTANLIGRWQSIDEYVFVKSLPEAILLGGCSC